MYRLCGDNIDKTIKPRYMRSDRCNKGTIHYFHSYALADRIDFSYLSDVVPPLPRVSLSQIATSVLPSAEDNKLLLRNFTTLLSRVRVENVQV